MRDPQASADLIGACLRALPGADLHLGTVTLRRDNGMPDVDVRPDLDSDWPLSAPQTPLRGRNHPHRALHMRVAMPGSTHHQAGALRFAVDISVSADRRRLSAWGCRADNPDDAVELPADEWQRRAPFRFVEHLQTLAERLFEAGPNRPQSAMLKHASEPWNGHGPGPDPVDEYEAIGRAWKRHDAACADFCDWMDKAREAIAESGDEPMLANIEAAYIDRMRRADHDRSPGLFNGELLDARTESVRELERNIKELEFVQQARSRVVER